MVRTPLGASNVLTVYNLTVLSKFLTAHSLTKDVSTMGILFRRTAFAEVAKPADLCRPFVAFAIPFIA